MNRLLIAGIPSSAAKVAVSRWHYSRKMPTGRLLKLGVWEDGMFTGAVIFGLGANRNIGRPFGLPREECAELVRIAMRHHDTPVSRVIAISLRMLQHHSPGIRLVVSYADPAAGHVGTVYQAAGWTYTGTSQAMDSFLAPNGARYHWRSLTGSVFGHVRSPAPGMVRVQTVPKYRYARALDPALGQLLQNLAQPYPQAEAGR